MARVEEEHTVREQLEGDDVDQTLQAVDSLGYSNDLGSVGNRVIVLVTDDDFGLAYARQRANDSLLG